MKSARFMKKAAGDFPLSISFDEIKIAKVPEKFFSGAFFMKLFSKSLLTLM